MEIRELLEKAGVTTGLSSEEVESFVSILEERKFKRGEIIITEVNRTRDMFILKSGSVAISFKVPVDDSKEEVVDCLHAGQIFGELSFVDGCPRSATVTAEESSEVVFLPHTELSELLDANPAIGYIVMKNIAKLITAKLRKTNLQWRNTLMW